MEKWQIEHIKSTLPDLIRNTTCSVNLYAILQSTRVLSTDDVEKIESKKMKGERAYELYKIVQTKCNGYDALLNALKETNQTVALISLQKSFPISIIKDKMFTFLGTNCKLMEILDDAQIENVFKYLKENWAIDDYAKLANYTGDSLHLVKNTIPAENKYYIPRILVQQIGVDPRVFEINAPDIFVFTTSTDEQQIRIISSKAIIRRSTEQLLVKRITGKFIILDVQDDWQQMKLGENKPMHLLHYQQTAQTFILLETTGGSSVLYQYLTSGDGSQETRILEENFIYSTMATENCRGACISDSPGMGKTLLLANLARFATRTYPNQVSGFFSLSTVGSMLAELTARQQTVSASKFLAKMLATSDFAEIVLEEYARSNNFECILFFDGLDEVCVEHMEAVTSFLRTLVTSMHKSRIYITSRIHIRYELEKILGVLAYAIEPFSDDNQKQFLISYWKPLCPNASEEKLLLFVNTSLSSINQKITPIEKRITGIPLLCRIMAEALKGQAQIYTHLQRQSVIEDTIFAYSLSELYCKYFSNALKIDSCYLKCFFKRNSNRCPNPESCRNLIFHVKLAIWDLFPQFAVYIRNHHSLNCVNEQTILSKGIIQKNCSDNDIKLKFVHRTFAEYLAAYFVGMVLLKNYKPSHFVYSKLEALFDDLLLCKKVAHFAYDRFYFRNSNVVFFLECFLRRAQNNFNLHEMFRLIALPAKPEKIYEVVVALVDCQYYSLLGLVVQKASHKYKRFTQCTMLGNAYRTRAYLHEKCQVLLDVLASRFDIETASILFKSFKKCFRINLAAACAPSRVNLPTPIETAIRLSNIAAVEFFLDQPHNVNGLLSVCVSFTNALSGSQLSQRLKIAELLANKHGLEVFTTVPSPLLSKNMHLKFIKLLIEAGASVEHEGCDKDSVLRNATNYMGKSDFLGLCRYLLFKCNAYKLFLSDTCLSENILIIVTVTSCLGVEAALEVVQMLNKFATNGVFPSGSTLKDEILKLCNIEQLRELCLSEHDLITSVIPEIRNFRNKPKLKVSNTLILEVCEGCRISLQIIILCMYGDIDLMSLNEINVFAVDGFENNVWHYLSMFGNINDVCEVRRYLEQNLAKQNSSEVVLPIFGRVATIKPNEILVFYLNSLNSFAKTPLHYAVQWPEMNSEYLDWFLMGGSAVPWNPDLVVVDINTCNRDGIAAMHIAINSEKSWKFLQHMFVRGADFGIKTASGDNLAHFCAKRLAYQSTSRNIYLLQIIVNLFEIDVIANERDRNGNYVLNYVLLKANHGKLQLCSKETIDRFIQICFKYGAREDLIC